jgi:hypothetical protein
LQNWRRSISTYAKTLGRKAKGRLNARGYLKEENENRDLNEKGLISIPWRSRLGPFLPQKTKIHLVFVRATKENTLAQRAFVSEA